jgi:cathepsin L
MNFIATGSLVSLSEQQLVDCSKKYGNMGCNGGLMDDAFNYVKDNGITTEAAYPYTGKGGTCESFKAVVKNTGHTDVAANSPSQMEAAVSKGPVSVAIEADKMVF